MLEIFFTCIHTYIYIYIYIYMYVCIYIYICMYVYYSWEVQFYEVCVSVCVYNNKSMFSGQCTQHTSNVFP